MVSATAKQQLYQLFIQRLESDWQEKYAVRFSGSWIDYRNSTTLPGAIFVDMRQSLKGVQGVEAPSKYTIGRVLQAGKFRDNAQGKILDGFAYYLTKEDFIAFEQSLEDYGSAITSDKTGPSNKIHRKWMVPGGVSLLLILVGFAWCKRGAMETDLPMATTTPRAVEVESEEFVEEKQHAVIAQTIRTANRLEYEGYERVGCGIFVDSLEYYFEETGRMEIVDRITRIHNAGGRLDWKPSGYSILALNVDSVDGNRATVLTRESWLLRWFFPGKKHLHYKEVNDHTYELMKLDGRWLVVSDEYPGAAESLEVKIEPMPSLPPSCEK